MLRPRVDHCSRHLAPGPASLQPASYPRRPRTGKAASARKERPVNERTGATGNLVNAQYFRSGRSPGSMGTYSALLQIELPAQSLRVEDEGFAKPAADALKRLFSWADG